MPSTIFYVGGISCAGKSTRCYALHRFLLAHSEYASATPYYYENADGVPRIIGTLFTFTADRQGNAPAPLLIIGKPITRNGATAWQGLDSFTNFLQADRGQWQLYACLWQLSREFNLLVDASLMVRSPKARPTITAQHTDADVYTCMFTAKDVEEYATRLSLRSERAVTKDSGMWKSNASFSAHVRRFNEEALHFTPGKYIAEECNIFTPVSYIGVKVLNKLAPILAPKFRTFCDDFDFTHLATRQ